MFSSDAWSISHALVKRAEVYKMLIQYTQRITSWVLTGTPTHDLQMFMRAKS